MYIRKAKTDMQYSNVIRVKNFHYKRFKYKILKSVVRKHCDITFDLNV